MSYIMDIEGIKKEILATTLDEARKDGGLWIKHKGEISQLWFRQMYICDIKVEDYRNSREGEGKQ